MVWGSMEKEKVIHFTVGFMSDATSFSNSDVERDPVLGRLDKERSSGSKGDNLQTDSHRSARVLPQAQNVEVGPHSPVKKRRPRTTSNGDIDIYTAGEGGCGGKKGESSRRRWGRV